MNTVDIKTRFTRQRTLVWVCDIQGSSSALNDPKYVDITEEFLKRFFWLSSILLRTTNGLVTKWTGDGFLAAYNVSLDRELGSEAKKIIEAAWHLTFLVNITQLGIDSPHKFRVRHGIAWEPDAIIVEHNTSSSQIIDIIGRGVVLAFRFSGIKAPFPAIVTEKHIVKAAQTAGSKFYFKKLLLSTNDILKYFKGERRSTDNIYISAERLRSAKTLAVAKARAQNVLNKIEISPEGSSKWLTEFCNSLQAGPKWTQDLIKQHAEFIEKELVGLLKSILAILKDTR